MCACGLSARGLLLKAAVESMAKRSGLTGALACRLLSDPPCPIRFIAPALSNGLCLSRPPVERGGVSESPVAASRDETKRSKRLFLAKNVFSSFRLGIFKLVLSHPARPEIFRRLIHRDEAARTVDCLTPHTVRCTNLPSPSRAAMQQSSQGSIVPCSSPNPAVMPPVCRQSAASLLGVGRLAR